MPLFYEWTRDYIKAFFGNGDAGSRTSSATLDFDNPIDLEFGPDGSLYVLEYGDGFFGKNLPGAELARVDFVGAARQPRAERDGRGRHDRGPERR